MRHYDDPIRGRILRYLASIAFVPYLIRNYVLRLTEKFGWQYVAIVAIVYGVNQGLGEGWAFFAAQYLLTDPDSSECDDSGHCGLGLDADRYAEVDGFTNIPWQIKSIYGILSDTLPIGTMHRSPYILIAATSGILSYPTIAILATSAGVGVVAVLLLGINYSMASPDVIIDASVAERCRDHPKYASDLQTLCWGSFGIGKIVSSATSGPLYERIGSRGLFGLTTFTALAMLPPAMNVWRRRGYSAHGASSSLSATTISDDDDGGGGDCTSGVGASTRVSWLAEKPEPIPRACGDFSPFLEAFRDKTRGTLIRLSLVVCFCSICMGLVAMTVDDDMATLGTGLVISAAICTAVYTYERKISVTLAKASVYIFIQGAIQPSTSVMYLWFKETDSNCDTEAEAAYGKRPCFSASFYSKMITVSYVFFVIGTAMYNRYFSTWSYRKIWTMTQIVLVGVNLLDLVWVLRWNVDVGIPDEVFFLGEELIGPLISRLNTMPLFILAAKLCPPKMEGTLFAMNMGLSNFGVVMGSYMGNGLLHALGGVEGPEFRNLDALVVIRSFARLLPILLIPFLVPKGSPNDSGGEGSATGKRREGTDEEEERPLSPKLLMEMPVVSGGGMMEVEI